MMTPQETAKERLVTVRIEGRRTKDELDKLVQDVRKLDAAIALAQGDMGALADAIEAHLVGKPDPQNFPSDEEMAAWQGELARLEEARLEQSRHITNLKHERAYPVQAAVNLDAALARLRVQLRNLTALSRGEKIGQWEESGINTV